MAWNPLPEVAVARDTAKKLNKNNIVIIAFNEDDNTYQVITYGKTKQLCALTKKMGDLAWKTIYNYLETLL